MKGGERENVISPESGRNGGGGEAIDSSERRAYQKK
jgi:hypothetical protein